MTLSTFLTSHKKRKDQVQTHTWFASGTAPVTLHIPNADVPALRQLIVNEVKGVGKQQAGANSVTEKIAKGTAFRFAVDIDFAADDVARWGENHGIKDAELRRMLVEKLQRIVAL